MPPAIQIGSDDEKAITKAIDTVFPHTNRSLCTKHLKDCNSERVWLKWKGNGIKKKRLKEQFLLDRNSFDKLLRQEKRRYQQRKQDELLTLSAGSNTKEFWRKIGQLGIANERRNMIPVEVMTNDGSYSNDIDIVFETWKSKYQELYNTSDGEYDFLSTIKQQMEYNTHNTVNTENRSELLNTEITIDEVEKAVFRAKLNKASGLDQICAEFLRNNSCINILYKIIHFAFENGVVPETWNKTLINPILKPDKDCRDPLGYRGIALVSIPCKIFADILNMRLSLLLEDNNILADEQNGFRKERSCMEHLYALTCLISNRKIGRKSTFACLLMRRIHLIL